MDECKLGMLQALRANTGLSQRAFAEWLHIPLRTYEQWERGLRYPPEYLVELIRYRVESSSADFKSRG